MSTPQTTISVCSGVPLHPDYTHTIWFDTVAKQSSYFAGKVVKTFSAYSYQRRSWSIKVEATMEQARKWSYLYFKNANEKTFYYFITKIEYINDYTVELFLEMDVLQTYHFDYKLRPCFIEREHSATDEPGDNLIDEGLEVGDLINNTSSIVSLDDLCVLILSTINPSESLVQDTKVSALGHYTDNVFSGLSVYCNNSAGGSSMANMLQRLDGKGWSDCIVAIWMYPMELVETEGTPGDSTMAVRVLGSKTKSEKYSRPVTIDSYHPRNKKLLTYPYQMLYVTGNAGVGATYRYEYFTDPNNCTFTIAGAISPNAPVIMYPLTYKRVTANFEEGVTGVTFPSCGWSSDVFKMWLAQNSHQQTNAYINAGLSVAGGIGMMAASTVTGGMSAVGGAGLMMSGLTQINGMMAQRKDMEVQPPQAKGSYSSSLAVANQEHNFKVLRKCITKERAEILDDYFDMYGYKTMRVKRPNRNVRENYTYTKTVDCHIDGDMCTEDILKIQSIYDKGITFWKNPDYVGSYKIYPNEGQPYATPNSCTGGE